MDWLDQHSMHYSPLVLKPQSAHYIKTPVWKVSTCEVLAINAQARKVVFVDDDEATRKLYASLSSPTPLLPYTLECYASLNELLFEG